MQKLAFSQETNLLNRSDPWNVLPQLLAGRTVGGVLDAGAGNGRTTRKLLDRFPQAVGWAFEPHPDCREDLAAVAETNPRVRPQYLALADRAGELEFYQTQSLGSSSLMRPGEGLQRAAGNVGQVDRVSTVPAVRLDDWWDQQNRPPIEVLKFDIQGGERAALNGGRRVLGEAGLLVYIEVQFQPFYEGGALFGELDHILGECGYRIHNLYKPHENDRGTLLYANAIYAHVERMGL
jgi:FkbM family methyltransferase